MSVSCVQQLTQALAQNYSHIVITEDCARLHTNCMHVVHCCTHYMTMAQLMQTHLHAFTSFAAELIILQS